MVPPAKLMRPFCFLFLLFGMICTVPVRAEADPVITTSRAIRADLLFERFSSKNGLPDDRIRAFYQDSRGFLWIGTMNGLSKYDGYSFQKFYKNQQTGSLSGNWTNAICEDTAHALWIGTKDGLNRFDPRRETFTNFRNRSGDPTSLFCNQINTLLFDGRGKLWIGTLNGLARFDPVSQQFERFSGYPFNLPIGKLIRSDGDYIWIATADGPVRCNIRTLRYTFYRLTVRPNPYGDRFWSLLEDHHHLYIGTGGDGLIRLNYNAKQQRYDRFESLNGRVDSPQNLIHTEIYDLCKADSDDFWLGTDRGLVRLEKPGSPAAQVRLYNHNPINEKSISNNRVYKVILDRTRVLWCGTESGLNKLDLHLLPFHYFTFTNQQGSDQVRSLLCADGRTVWLGTAQSGLFRYNLTTGTTQTIRFQPEPSFRNFHRSLLIDANQNLWLGTLAGASRLVAGSYTRPQVEIDGAAVFSFLQDSHQTIWIGTTGGLYKVNADGTKTRYPVDRTKPGNTSSEFVRSLYEDHTGTIWVGFENTGLYRFDPKTGVFSPVSGNRTGLQLIGNTVYSILEMPKNVLWVGTESGLNRIILPDKPGANQLVRIKTYREPDGLPDQSVNGILADRQGVLWISTIKGLARFDRRSEQFHVYLPTLNFTHSCLSRVDHKLLFGASDGFVLFDPADISTDTSVPDVVLSDLRLFNKEVAIGQVINGDTILHQSLANTPEITLNHQNNGFTLGFTGLHFSNPDQNRYAYQMAGFNPNWILTDARNRTATFTNLDPGTYTFRVKAANSSGQWQWNSRSTSVQITVLPPPWKSWWAMTGYVLLIGGLFYGFVQYLLTQARQRQQLRFEQLEKEQLRNLNQLKMNFFTDISHEFRTPLLLIVGPVEDLLMAGDIRGVVRQKVLMVHHNCRKLLHLIDELMTFQKLEQGMLTLKPERLDLVAFVEEIHANFDSLADRKQIQFRFITDSSSLFMLIDPDKLEKVFNNLISNALKFTPPGGSVRVHIGPVAGSDTDWIEVSVEDTGKGITPDEQVHLFERYFQSETTKTGTGVGLSLTKSLVELHRGMIQVASEPGVRTCFRVLLPADLVSIGRTGELPSQSFIAEPERSLERDRGEGVFPSLPGLLPRSEADRPEILVVDDNSDVLDFLELIFQDRYRVTRAETGRQALHQIRQQEPAIIISDIMMPDMNGIELCHTLKTNLATCHIPLILLTARSTVENQVEGIGTGADEYMPKPFHPELLRVRVEKLIESRRQLIEKFQANAVIIPQDFTHNPLDEAFMQKVLDTINANLSNEAFSVEELSTHVNMSRSNLFRKLKAITGQTPIEFIYHIRLKHAMTLLLTRKLNISEITYEVGFKNPSAFGKSFRKQFGKAPTDYLRDMLTEQQLRG